MASLRNQIIAAIVTALSATDPEKPSGLVVHRSRTRPVTGDEKHLIVYNGKEKAVQMGGKGGPLTVRRHIVRIEARARGEPIDEALDPLLVWAVKALLADPTLGGLSTDLMEDELTWEIAQSEDDVYGVANMDIVVEYQTLRTDSTRRR